jgi:hypothetical protein
MDCHLKHMRDEAVYRDAGDVSEARRQQQRAKTYEEVVVRFDQAIERDGGE